MKKVSRRQQKHETLFNMQSVRAGSHFPVSIFQDFGKFPRMRQFVQEYIQALNCQNAGLEVVGEFIKR